MARKKKIFLFACTALLIFLFFAFSLSAAGEQASASSPSPGAPDAKEANAVAANPPSQTSTTQIVISVIVNTQPRGDFFIELDDAGKMFFKPEDLDTLKLNYPKERTVLIHDEQYVPLDAVLDIKHVFDEKKLTLSFIGKTTAEEKTSVDLFKLRVKPQNIYYPRETSAFFNYGLTYNYANPDGFQSFLGTSKLGARTGDVFLVSDSLYTKTPQSEQFVRLQSSATYERRDDLQWLVMGDQFASSGDLGSTMNMGGVGFSKVYRLDPYFITQPVLDLKGTAIFPTQAEIYLDGILVGKQAIAPGSFDLKNLYSYNGSHNVELILRDPFGNAQRVSYSVYFNTLMLRQGLQEYSYNVGFLRKNYGVTSADYESKPAFSAFHRYGVTNSLNIGVRAEGTDGIYNGGVSAQFTVPHLGAFSLSLAESDANGSRGSAGALQHNYQFGNFNTNLLLREFSRDYVTVNTPVATDDQTRYEAGFGVGLLLMPLGSLSLNYSENEIYSGTKMRNTSVNYSRGIYRTTSMFATASESRQLGTTTYSIFLGLNFNFDQNVHGAIQYSKTGDVDTETAQIQKDVPVGEGLGYRAALTRTNTGTTTSSALNPFVQYNARYGIYSLDSTVQQTSDRTSESYSLSAAGSLVYAGGFYGLSRPVSDSFSIVTVDDVPNAAVFNNGQEIGKTNSSGTLVVPTLTSYGQNQITLETKNIPLDYSISGINKAISPSLWSGSCVAFNAVKTQAITGSLHVMQNSEKIPVEFQEGIISIGTKNIAFPTGKGGEFYIENTLPKEAKEAEDPLSCRAIAEQRRTGAREITPGTYPAFVDINGKKCSFQLTFPETGDVFTDLGEIICELPKAMEKTP
jgi:outer membrane usher protein